MHLDSVRCQNCLPFEPLYPYVPTSSPWSDSTHMDRVRQLEAELTDTKAQRDEYRQEFRSAAERESARWEREKELTAQRDTAIQRAEDAELRAKQLWSENTAILAGARDDRIVHQSREREALVQQELVRAEERERCDDAAWQAVADAFESQERAVSKGSAPYSDVLMKTVLWERISGAIRALGTKPGPATETRAERIEAEYLAAGDPPPPCWCGRTHE
jgi:hypothetical protein